eukprot:2903701-Lingulodinium_polyedra.AAC.1
MPRQRQERVWGAGPGPPKRPGFWALRPISLCQVRPRRHPMVEFDYGCPFPCVDIQLSVARSTYLPIY